MKKPNFFIVGAPKCGTTALSEYLREHPNIYVSHPKEPHYFAEDFPEYRTIKTLEDYLNLFQETTNDHLAIGEASVFYLYSSVAIQKIKEFNPDAKIIVMIRNPIELTHSFHSQLLYTVDENEQDFETAWRLQPSRQQGLNISSSCREPKLLQYQAIGKLGEQLTRLLTIFPSEQVKIIRQEDFSQSTQKVYQEVLEFLNVPSDYRVEFPRINQNKSHKSKVLGWFTQKTPQFLVDSVMVTKKSLGIERLNIKQKIRKMNTQVKSRQPITDNFRAEMIDEFRSDIEKISKIIHQDLDHWCH